MPLSSNPTSRCKKNKQLKCFSSCKSMLGTVWTTFSSVSHHTLPEWRQSPTAEKNGQTSDKQVGHLFLLENHPDGSFLKALVLTCICSLKEISSPPWTDSAGKKAGDTCWGLHCQGHNGERKWKDDLEGIQWDCPQVPWHGFCSFRIPRDRSLPQGWGLVVSLFQQLHCGFYHYPTSVFTLHISWLCWMATLKTEDSHFQAFDVLLAWRDGCQKPAVFYSCGIRCTAHTAPSKCTWFTPAKCSRKKDF